jgi:cytochrome c5
MKKVITIVFAIGLFGLFLASCGNSGTKEAKKETTKETKKALTVNLENGKAIYGKACIACHWKGVAGAAALTDKARWEEIAGKGMNTIHEHAIAGFQGEYGVMPEKGTCTDCTSQDIYDAIGYMLNEAGVTAQ